VTEYQVIFVAVGRVETTVIEVVEVSVSVDVKVTVVVLKTVFVYNVAVGLRLYCCEVLNVSNARFSRA
jgi:hypothetical protein